MSDPLPHAWLTLADLAAEMRVSEDEAWRLVRRANPYRPREYRPRSKFRVRRERWDQAIKAVEEADAEARVKAPRPSTPTVGGSWDLGRY